ncbi:MAG: SH3 domain-containing protein [Anaerovoracaceae bacterium]
MKNTRFSIILTTMLIISMFFSVINTDIVYASNYIDYKPDKKGKALETVNFRKDAGIDFEKIGSIKKGSSVVVFGYKLYKNEKWYKTKVNEKYGYVLSKYIKITGTSSNVEEKPESNVKTFIYKQLKKGKTTEGINVRSGPGTTYKKISSLTKGKTLNLYGYKKVGEEKWYMIKINNKTAYVFSKYVENLGYIDGEDEKPDPPKPDPPKPPEVTGDFEESLVAEGFPSSYKSKLRELHKEHPKWIFKAHNTNLNFSTVVSKEKEIGNNLVASYNPETWRSFEKGAYDFGKKKPVLFDGKWLAAHESVIKYHLDPRNFLDDTAIFQFLSHEFDENSQNKDTIRGAVTGSFMDSDGYANIILEASRNAGVNPNVVGSMLLLEQGYKGTSGLISGKYKGYEGYYNFFNIGAYHDGKRTAIERGLWFAKGGDNGDTSYNRPWNTKTKAIQGGAMYFKNNYTNKNQNTLYTKKYNVMNGEGMVAKHEYSTAVYAGVTEGKLLSKAYNNNSDYPLVFYIPVYKNMPSSNCKLPGETGNNNNLLDSLSVEGYSLNTKFDRYNNSYRLTIPNSIDSLEVKAEANNSETIVTGTGNVNISNSTKTIYIKARSSSGLSRTYSINLDRE